MYLNIKQKNIMENTSVAYLEAKGKSKVWMAYANHFASQEIIEEGFNLQSGYVYIALESGITIASAFGQEVDFITYNFDTDEEIILGSFEELENYLEKVN